MQKRSSERGMASGRWRSLAFFPALATAAIWLAVTPVLAADAKVRIFSGTDEHWVQFQVAKAKGFFKDEGLDAEVIVFTTGATATEAFRAGRGDFISAGDLPSAAMWKTGNAVGIAPMSSDTEIFGIVGKNNINSPADLRGRKVATRTGSTAEFLLYRHLASGGPAHQLRHALRQRFRQRHERACQVHGAEGRAQRADQLGDRHEYELSARARSETGRRAALTGRGTAAVATKIRHTRILRCSRLLRRMASVANLCASTSRGSRPAPISASASIS